MPFGYVVTMAIISVACWLALAPPIPATSRPTHWTYRLGGFLVNELPFVTLLWLTYPTVQAAVDGDLDTPLGLIGLAIATIALIELCIILRRGVRARAELAAALDTTFGPSSQTTEGTSSADEACRSGRMPSRHRWWQLVFMPLSFRGRQVQRVANIAYGDAGRRNQLDVYHHREHTGGPVLVYFHGGGFRSGHKNREAKPLLHRLARRGWVCVSANYRLAPYARFADPLIDAKQVIAWARRHAGDYGGDATRVYVAGSSAGGHIATMCALTPNHDQFDAAAGTQDIDTSVVGVISLYGFYGSPDTQPELASSPHDYLNPAAPPMFIAHGDIDTLVLVDDTRAFARDLDNVSSNPVVYAELHGAQHGFDLFRSPRFEAVVDAIEVFITRTQPRREPHAAGEQ
jgi:acetyl esterase/lipase